MKNERGITLLSLVVTIIVMLILAGVAIRGSLHENGGIINGVKDETLKQQIPTKTQYQLYLDMKEYQKKRKTHQKIR